MEDISISFCHEKDEQQTIVTIVDISDLNENVELQDSPTALIHSVLEVPISNSNKDSISLKAGNPYCLVCNAKLSVSRRGAMNIFSKELKSSSRQLDLDFLLGSILNCELEAGSSHSEIICRKCFKLVEDFDVLQSQLNTIKKELNDKYVETKSVLSGVHISYADDEGGEMLQNDLASKNCATKGRLKKKKTDKGSLQYSNIKMEVKQEPEELIPFIHIEGYDGIQGLMKSVCEDNSSSSSADLCGVDGSTELDGLDVDYEDGVFQFDGMETEEGNNGVKNSLLLQMENYKCRFCKMKGTFANVQRHLVEVHSDRLYECEVCEDRCSSRIQLMEHINAHLATGEKPFACSLCNEAYGLPRQLKEHLKKHTEGLPCYHCARRFQSHRALQQHINSHNGNLRPFPCEQCGKKFTSRTVLKSHAKTHGSRTRSHKCTKCEKLFCTFHHLREHSRIHQTRKDHVCEICGKAFSTVRSLDTHSLTHTGIKNFACRICQKAFLRKGEVEDHERIHTGEKPFQCEFCGAVFSQRSNLLSHKKATHLQQKNYTCVDCNKAFKRRRLLKYHMQSVHTGERPYKCSWCKASFVYPEHYKKHLRIHTGLKPFKCDICSKAFNSKDNRNAHKFIHSDKKQYECLICGTGYMRKAQVTRHILQHGHVDNVADFIKINSSSIVDEEILGPRTISMSDEEVESGLTTLQIVKDPDSVFSRPLHIVESEMTIKSEDEVGHFLTTLGGQVVEVRAEDLEKYAQLTADQITQISQVTQANIGEVGQLSSVTGECGAFEIQLDDPDPLTMAVSSQ